MNTKRDKGNGGDLVNMHCLIERELHRNAKIYAVRQGMTLRELISKALAREIS